MGELFLKGTMKICKCNIGALNNYLYYFGVPYYKYSIVYPKTLF